MDQDFSRKLKDFARGLSGEDNFLVVSHHDADGITACAITVDLLRSLGKEVDFKVTKQLDSTTINEVIDSPSEVKVFTDMGSGQINLIQEHIDKYFIIDHHPPERESEYQVNPHFYGFDGGRDVSGAGMAYLVARSLGHDCMANTAIVGAVGDMQDNGGRLHSINRDIMDDAVRQKTLKVKNDLRLFGRQSRPIAQMLAYSSDPFIPGLTGNTNACKQFIEDLGLELKKQGNEWKSYVDLTWKERKKLASAVYMRLLDYGTPEYIIQGMVGEVYTLLKERRGTELRDAKEYATLLNACGRQDQPEIGVEVCLGNRDDALRKAEKLLETHRRMLRDGIDYLKKNGVKPMDHLYFFDAGDTIKESIIGVVAGMAYGARIIPPNKPVIALAVDKDEPGLLKVSARANWGLVRRGLHLGNAMREGSNAFGGEGGGHDIAAGARIPMEAREDFLEKVDNIFKNQLTS